MIRVLPDRTFNSALDGKRDILIVAEKPYTNTEPTVTWYADKAGSVYVIHQNEHPYPWLADLGELAKRVGWPNMALICEEIERFMNEPADTPADANTSKDIIIILDSHQERLAALENEARTNNAVMEAFDKEVGGRLDEYEDALHTHTHPTSDQTLFRLTRLEGGQRSLLDKILALEIRLEKLEVLRKPKVSTIKSNKTARDVD